MSTVKTGLLVQDLAYWDLRLRQTKDANPPWRSV